MTALAWVTPQRDHSRPRRDGLEQGLVAKQPQRDEINTVCFHVTASRMKAELIPCKINNCCMTLPFKWPLPEARARETVFLFKCYQRRGERQAQVNSGLVFSHLHLREGIWRVYCYWICLAGPQADRIICSNLLRKDFTPRGKRTPGIIWAPLLFFSGDLECTSSY